MRLRISNIHDWTFWHYQVLGWSLFAGAHYAANIALGGWRWPIIGSLTLQFTAGFLLTLLMRRYYRGLPYQNMGIAQLVAHMMGASFIATLIWTECWVFITYVFSEARLVWYASQPHRIAQIVAIAFPDKLAWSALYFGIKLWREWGIERDLAEAATATAHTAQLQALRYQLNPHFLFNALNAMRALIDEDTRAAKTLVTELSEFLRYSLVNRDRATVPIRDELAAVRLYLSIEQRRYEDKLIVDIDADPGAAQLSVPAFTVHTLVEHALRTGLRNGPLPVVLSVRVRASDGRLRVLVRQSGVAAPANGDTATAGEGLSNLEERLQDSFTGQAQLRVIPEEQNTLYELEIQTTNGDPHEASPARSDR